MQKPLFQRVRATGVPLPIATSPFIIVLASISSEFNKSNQASWLGTAYAGSEVFRLVNDLIRPLVICLRLAPLPRYMGVYAMYLDVRVQIGRHCSSRLQDA